MTLYSVYEPREEAPDLLVRAEGLRFVKEGFSWPALFVPILWLIYHRLWIEVIGFIIISGLIEWLCSLAPQGDILASWAAVAVMVLFGFEANDIRGAALERRGYRFAGTALGRGREGAEFSFFRDWLPGQDRFTRTGDRALERTAPSLLVGPRRGGNDEIIGSFPGA